MTVTVVLPGALEAELLGAASEEVETAAVLLAHIAQAPSGDLRLLVRAISWVPPEGYHRRERNLLDIVPEGYVGALAAAEMTGCVPIWTHTHPGEGSSPVHSVHDDKVDSELENVFRIRSGSQWYASLVIARANGALTFAGRLVGEDGQCRPIDRIWSVGDRWRLTPSAQQGSAALPGSLDRNVRAFGGPVQRAIGDLRVAVVGCGGTGSAVVEQLVRLGAQTVTLCDPDVLSPSNVTRVYGSTPSDAGVPKVDVLATHARAINPDISIRTLNGSVSAQQVAQELTDADLVFGCTDDNAGRVVLSRLAVYYNVPLIDMGVLLDSSGGALRGIYGRVTTVTYGSACLICRDRIDLGRAQSEALSPSERRRRIDEGYAPELPRTEPAVVAYTTMVAALAVNELLDRLIGFGETPMTSELILRGHDRAMSSNHAIPRTRHYCDPGQGLWGRGDTELFLERTWAC